MKEKHPTRILFYIALVLGALFAAARVFVSRASLESGIELYAHNTPAATALHAAITVAAVGLLLAGIVCYLPKHKDPAKAEKQQTRGDAARRRAEKKARAEKMATLSPSEALAYRHEEKQKAAKDEYKRAEARYARQCTRMESAFAVPSKTVMFLGVFVGIMLLLYDVTVYAALSETNFNALAPLLGRVRMNSSNMASAVLALLHLVSALPAALYFFKAATTHKKPSPAFGILASCPAIWCLLTILTIYFRLDVAFNSPTKLLRLAALVIFMLWQVQEGRMLLGIPKRGLFAGFGAAAAVLMLTMGISDVVLYAMGVISLAGGYIEGAMYIAFGLYTVARCVQHE